MWSCKREHKLFGQASYNNTHKCMCFEIERWEITQMVTYMLLPCMLSLVLPTLYKNWVSHKDSSTPLCSVFLRQMLQSNRKTYNRSRILFHCIFQMHHQVWCGWGSYMLCKCMNLWTVYEARMSPTPSEWLKSSAYSWMHCYETILHCFSLSVSLASNNNGTSKFVSCAVHLWVLSHLDVA